MGKPYKQIEKIDVNPNERSIDRLEQVTVKLNEIVEWINEQIKEKKK